MATKKKKKATPKTLVGVVDETRGGIDEIIEPVTMHEAQEGEKANSEIIQDKLYKTCDYDEAKTEKLVNHCIICGNTAKMRVGNLNVCSGECAGKAIRL
jgi:hypothetical protein